ncbi:MAG: type 4a pilus biogenesis protein PilO [Candidatus Riflebacteria bacterium]|nr:type 4a pilus biogenesis protein PilO [Candidatus Riflebacteria bacterium]
MRNTVIIIVLICAIIFIDYTQYRPARLDVIHSQIAAIAALENDIGIAEAAQAKIATVKTDIEKLQISIAQRSRRFPQKSQAGELLDQVTTFAINQGLKIDSYKPSGPTPKNVNITTSDGKIGTDSVNYEEMQVSIAFNTSFKSLGEYLDGLEKIPLLIEISGLDLKTAEAHIDPKSSLIVLMDAKTYIYGGN